jgi:hypothetical protein
MLPMRKLFACMALLLTVCLLLPSEAEGQKKPGKKGKKPSSEPATAQDYAALAQYKELVGVLMNIEPTTKTMSIKVEHQHLEPNTPKGGKNNTTAKANLQMQRQLQQQQQFAREYQQILRIRNPLQQQQRMQQLMARMQLQQFKGMNLKNLPQNNPFKVVTSFKEYELEPVGDVKVARSQMGVVYDDKGNVKQYTPEELKKLRDPVMPGYKAKFEEVEPGMTVKFYLTAIKSSGQKKPATTGKDAGDEGGKVLGAAAEENRPQVRMILIQSEVDPSVLPKQPGQKKKKKN